MKRLIKEWKWVVSCHLCALTMATAEKAGRGFEFDEQGFQVVNELDFQIVNITDKGIRLVPFDISTEDPGNFSPDVNLERVLLQILVFICGAAGIFLLCCACCAQILSKILTSREIEIQRNAYNQILRESENMSTFASVHRNRHTHPWSPDSMNLQLESFSFVEYDQENDKPPSYDESVVKMENSDSSPPPPYTPSFRMEEKQ